MSATEISRGILCRDLQEWASAGAPVQVVAAAIEGLIDAKLRADCSVPEAMRTVHRAVHCWLTDYVGLIQAQIALSELDVKHGRCKPEHGFDADGAMSRRAAQVQKYLHAWTLTPPEARHDEAGSEAAAGAQAEPSPAPQHAGLGAAAPVGSGG